MQEPTIVIEPGLVCVWGGELSPNELGEYLAYRVDHEPDIDPQSDFSADLGVNHDMHAMAAGAVEDPLALIQLLKHMHYDEKVHADLLRGASANVHAEAQFRCAVLLWDRAPLPELFRRTFAGGRLRFLGCWPATPTGTWRPAMKFS